MRYSPFQAVRPPITLQTDGRTVDFKAGDQIPIHLLNLVATSYLTWNI
jgi:hypothetical protein